MVSEPPFALGLNCKAGEEINQCWGTGWDLPLPVPVNAADKLVIQIWLDCVGCQWPVCVPVMFIHVDLAGLTNLREKLGLYLRVILPK